MNTIGSGNVGSCHWLLGLTPQHNNDRQSESAKPVQVPLSRMAPSTNRSFAVQEGNSLGLSSLTLFHKNKSFLHPRKLGLAGLASIKESSQYCAFEIVLSVSLSLFFFLVLGDLCSSVYLRHFADRDTLLEFPS